MEVLANKKWVGVFFFLLVFLSKLPVINMPFHWDDLGGYINFALNIYRGIEMFPLVHPPFFFYLLALVWSIFGYSIWISHLVVILFSFLGVYFTYLLGTELKDSKTGFIAALFLFFSPLYFAQSGTLNLDLPLTSLIVATLYFFLRSNTKAYVLCGMATVLTKVPGMLLILSIIMHEAIQGVKRKTAPILKKIFIHGSILAIFILWAVYYYHKTNWVFLHPILHKQRPWDIINTMRAMSDIMRRLFFSNYHFILTIFIIGATLFRKIRVGIYALVFLIIAYFIRYTFFPHIAVGFGRPIVYSIIFIAVAVRMTAKNINYLPVFLSVFLIICSLSIFRAICCLAPRYLLVVYPLFFIVSAACLTDIGKKNNLLSSALAIAFILLSIKGWYGHRNKIGGYALESNLEYLDQIKTHRLACKFIADHYPNKVVLTSWPQRCELSEPAFGYVTLPVSFIDFRLQENIDPQRIDLIYYSDQSDNAAKMKKLMENFNLTLLQSYQCNGKTAAVYKVIKNQFQQGQKIHP
jgi:4-amino-4-deoxy-L-arabinose transferase-like glycosyltransferase